LDIGCGAGRDYQLFAEGEYDYTGIDYSKRLLAIARLQFPAGQFMFGNIFDLPFEDGAFDGFWAAASLLHIPKEKIAVALASVHRVVAQNGSGVIMLKKGEGQMMVVDDSHSGDTDDQRFFAYWQRHEFTDVLQQCGFMVLSFSERSVSERTTWLSFFVKAS
jgi:ubiquinone/menaquinone biosynthesis C-methylase UbiE